MRKIADIYRDKHPVRCQCGHDVASFEAFVPTEGMDSASVLKLERIPKSPEFLWSHYTILASKFHPDKNDSSDRDSCTAAMKVLNRAYFDLRVSIGLPNEADGTISKRQSDKLYTLLDNETISCLHSNSFVIYGHPCYVDTWKTVIQASNEFKENRQVANGYMFGNRDDGVFLTVFDTGSVFAQGVMSCHFGIGRLQAELYHAVMRDVPNIVPKVRRAKTFLEAAKVLGVPMTSYGIVSKTTTLAEPDPSSPELEDTCSDSDLIDAMTAESDCDSAAPLSTCTGLKKPDVPITSNDSSDLMDKLKTATNVISTQQHELESARAEINKLNGRVAELEAQASRTANSLATIQKEQKHIESTFGAKLAELHKMNNTTPSYASMVMTQANIPQVPTQPNTSSLQSNRPASRSIPFCPDKCVVIYNVTEQPKSDDKIRQAVGKCDSRIIIDHITRASPINPKYWVQLAEPNMVAELISSWNENNFKGCKIRRPIARTAEYIGMAKGVPLDIDNNELSEALQQVYPGAQAYRIEQRRDGKVMPLRVVRIKFTEKTQLDGAVKDGLLLKCETTGYNLSVRVEEARQGQKRIVQCFKCYSFGHVAKYCTRSELCRECARPRHGDCQSATKRCTNCKGDHSARDWEKCPTFHRIKERLSRNGEHQ